MPSLSQPFRDVFFSTVSNAELFIDELFRKKFGTPAPDYGSSVIAFYKHSPLHYMPFCYMNYLPHDEILLSGGAMTDGAAFAEMPPALCDEIRAAGGIYFHLIRYAFEYFADDCEAIFGFAGDERAMEVDLAAGYEPTPYPFLIVRWNSPLNETRKTELIEKAHRVGAF